MYDTVEEADQKVKGSVVLYDNVPVYISAFTGNLKAGIEVHFLGLPLKLGESPTVKSLKDPLWDFRSMGTRLGYTRIFLPEQNIHDSVFLSRIPVRTSRQGLDNRTVFVSPVSKLGVKVQWQDVLSERGSLTETFSGKYPSLEEAFSNITTHEDTIKSLPINRRMCLINDKVNPPNILYRGEKVGYTHDGLCIRLAKHKRHLEEEFTDVYNLKVS